MRTAKASKPTTIWLTPRYALDAPQRRDGSIIYDNDAFKLSTGWTYHGYAEGKFWHRKYADAARVARRNRESWLRELTTKAAEIAALLPIPDLQEASK